MKQKQILALLQDMSLPEKIGQMVQMVGMLYDAKEQGIITGPMMADMKVTEEDLKMAGSSLLLYGGEKLARIQKSYMENQPHHIPQMFMYDVIHGMKTIFPVPLAQGASLIRCLQETVRLSQRKRQQPAESMWHFRRWSIWCVIPDGDV